MGLKKWSPELLVQVADQDDRERASDGHSRYGAYLADREHLFQPGADGVLAPQDFAAAAWSVATGPVMAPGYVRVRPDVSRVRVRVEDGALVVDVEVPVWHRCLAEGRRERSWADWEVDWDLPGEGDYRPVRAPHFTGAPLEAVLVSAVVRVGCDARELPPAPPQRASRVALTSHAQEAVHVLARQINAVAAPLVAQLHGASRRR